MRFRGESGTTNPLHDPCHHGHCRAKNQKPQPRGWGFFLIGQRPTLPHTRACSTIGAERLNFRVRDGNGWDPLAMITQNLLRFQEPEKIRTALPKHSDACLLTPGSLNIDGTCHNELLERLRLLCIHSKILWSSRTGY